MPTQRPSYLKILSNHSFFSLWFGQLISVTGDAVFDVALLWLVLTTTGSVFLVGITQAIIYLPSVVVSPFAGVYVDRLNRRSVMLLSNVAQGIIVAIISLLYAANSLSFQVLLVLVFALYSTSRFFLAAMRAIIPRMVENRTHLVAANSLFTLTSSFSQFASYAFGGIVILFLGVALPLTYDGFTFFFAAIMLLFVAKHYGEISRRTDPTFPSVPSTTDSNDKNDELEGGQVKGSFRADFAGGLHYFLSSKLMIELVVLGITANFFLGGSLALLAPYAKLWIHGDASTYGFLLGAFSFGIFAGAYFVGKLRNVGEYVGTFLFFGVIANGIIIALIGLVTTQFVSIGLFFVLGVLLSVVNVPLQALYQVKIPQEMFGRVYTVIVALLSVAMPVSAAVSGDVASIFSIGEVFTTYGVFSVCASVVAYVAFKELRTTKY